MKRMIGLLMMVVVVGGCGKEIEVVKMTNPFTQQVIEEYECYRDEDTNKPIKHGYYKSYYGDKSYKQVGNYKDDKKDGKWIEYYNGKLVREENYVNGKEEGKWIRYYESGKVEVEGNFVNGKQEGKVVWYDEEGNITDEDIYKDGECVEMCEGNE